MATAGADRLQIVGMVELNGTEHCIEVLKSDSFRIGDTSAMHEYHSGGVARQRKLPLSCAFASLAESLASPEFDGSMHGDFVKLHHPPLSLAGLVAVEQFRAAKGRLPEPWDQQDADSVLATVDAELLGDDAVWVAAQMHRTYLFSRPSRC